MKEKEIKDFQDDMNKRVKEMLIDQAGGSLFINKIEECLKEKMEETLENVLDTPFFKIERIRWVHNFSFFKEENGEKMEVKEDAFIVECEVEDEHVIDGLTILLADREIEERGWLPERDTDTYHLLKSVLCHQMWYNYAVIWGELDTIFDKKVNYEAGGKYAGENYTQFNKKNA